MPSLHFTYLIWSEAIRLTKIGHSADPKGRLTILSTANGNIIVLSHTWRGPRAKQVKLEGDLHRLLAWARSTGE